MDESLLCLYFSYKRATKVPFDWLLSTVGHELPGGAHSRLTTTEYVKAARIVEHRKLIVPRYILSNLRDGLSKRQRVHTLYVELDDSDHQEGNSKHKAFIDRLEQIYQILLPLGETPQSPECLTSKRNKNPQSNPSANRYAWLTEVSLTEEIDEQDDTTQEETTSEDASSPHDTQQVLQDDTLGEYIELSLLVYEFDAINAKVNGYWADVASGKLSMVVAGILTNMAYHAVQQIVEAFPGLLADNQDLCNKWYFTKQGFRLRFTDIPELQSDYHRFSKDLGLWRYWRILHDCRTLDEYNGNLPTAGGRQKPADNISKLLDCCDNSHLDDSAFDKMQESMRQLLRDGRAISKLEKHPMSAEHLLPAFNEALEDQNSKIPTYLVFGMEMLLSTYKAYLWPHGVDSNCRILSLKLANDVIKSVKSCIACLQRLCQCQDPDKCTCCQKEWICEFQEKIQSYVHEKRFDLYYQAPWIAAGHMVEILSSCTDEGIQLCCGNNYVTAVLHLYNALREVSPDMRRLLWLDQMCGNFTDTLFLGSLPKRNFSSIFRKSSGGKLIKTASSSDGAQYRFSSGISCISDRDVDTSRLSMLYTQHRASYQMTPVFVVRLHLGRKVKDPTQSQIRKALREINSTVWTVTMDKMEKAVQDEFTGEAPIARINFFAVFEACIQILEKLCGRLNGSEGASAELGFHLVDHLLAQIADHEKDAKLDRLLPYLLPLKKAVLSFASMDETMSLNNFAWDV